MSDLQCAVRVFLVPGNVPDPVPGGLAAERVVVVLAPPTGPLRGWAAGVGDALSCRVEHRDDLQDVDGTVAALHELADLYRGEAVLVVLEPAAVPELLQRLGAAPSQGAGDTARSIMLVEGDADGWAARRWPEEST